MTLADAVKLTLLLLAPLLTALSTMPDDWIAPPLKHIALAYSGAVPTALAFTERMGRRAERERRQVAQPEPHDRPEGEKV